MELRFKLSEISLSFLIGLLTVVLYLGFADFQLLRTVEGGFVDLRFQIRGTKAPSDHIAIVQIDDKSIGELGRWPWNRQQFAAAIDRLSNDGAKVIILDLLFSEKQHSIDLGPIEKLRATLETENTTEAKHEVERLNTLLDMVGTFEDRLNPDRLLAQAIQRAGNVLVPYSFVFEKGNDNFNAGLEASLEVIEESSFKAIRHVDGQRPNLGLIATNLMPPIPVLTKSAFSMGHVNVALDADGAARYDYPVVSYRGEFYPSIALQAARVFLGYRPEEMRAEFNEGIQLGDTWIPTDDSMRLVTNFNGPNQTYPIHSFSDVVSGRVPRSAFEGKIVLIGASAIGVVDHFVTPYSAVLTGTERIATIIDNILHQESLFRRNFLWLAEVAIALAGSILLGWAATRLTPYYLSLSSFGLGLAYTGANLALFAFGNIWLNLMLPLVAWVSTYSCVMIFRFFIQERDTRKLRDAFGKYLSPDLVKLLSDDPKLLALGGEKRRLTVLFTDVRGFSAIAESMPPERLVPLINEFLTVISDIVIETGGLLDKYVGDSVMAIYGAPYPSDDHAAQACEAAVRMIEATEALNEQWRTNGLPSLRIGIGINTGDMIIGNMGSQEHFNYTAMGDEVNVAARLEQVNKVYGTGILISKETRDIVEDDFAVRELDECLVKGKTNAVMVYELLGRGALQGAHAEGIQIFEAGLEYYRNQLWQHAQDIFEKAHAKLGGDGPSEVFIDRCKQLIQSPPPEDWDGYVHDEAVTSVTRLHNRDDTEGKTDRQYGSRGGKVLQLGHKAT